MLDRILFFNFCDSSKAILAIQFIAFRRSLNYAIAHYGIAIRIRLHMMLLYAKIAVC